MLGQEFLRHYHHIRHLGIQIPAQRNDWFEPSAVVQLVAELPLACLPK
jgi:hypothetical protein